MDDLERGAPSDIYLATIIFVPNVIGILTNTLELKLVFTSN